MYLDQKEEGSINTELRDAYYYQADLNRQYGDPSQSPLKRSQLKKFESLSFFPLNEQYKIKAEFQRSADSTPFWMPTTTGRKSRERIFGTIAFELDGRSHKLQLYQELDSLGKPAMEDHLFLPFTDQTNGISTYPGGRYLDLSIPDSPSIVVDFNKAYNPYCAYNSKYSCPLVPGQNRLSAAIEAGVKYPEPWQN